MLVAFILTIKLVCHASLTGRELGRPRFSSELTPQSFLIMGSICWWSSLTTSKRSTTLRKSTQIPIISVYLDPRIRNTDGGEESSDVQNDAIPPWSDPQTIRSFCRLYLEKRPLSFRGMSDSCWEVGSFILLPIPQLTVNQGMGSLRYCSAMPVSFLIGKASTSWWRGRHVQ